MDETAACSVNRDSIAVVLLFILNRSSSNYSDQDTMTGHTRAQGMQGGRVVAGMSVRSLLRGQQEKHVNDDGVAHAEVPTSTVRTFVWFSLQREILGAAYRQALAA